PCASSSSRRRFAAPSFTCSPVNNSARIEPSGRCISCMSVLRFTKHTFVEFLPEGVDLFLNLHHASHVGFGRLVTAVHDEHHSREDRRGTGVEGLPRLADLHLRRVRWQQLSIAFPTSFDVFHRPVL